MIRWSFASGLRSCSCRAPVSTLPGVVLVLVGCTDPGASPMTGASCNPSAAADIEVSSNDDNAFPPYATSACTLVYVSREGSLVMRDLSGNVEVTVAPAREHPRRPAVSPDLIAWEADEDGRSVVRVRAVTPGASARTLAGPFASAGEPRARGTTVVFTAWNGPTSGDDTDVWLFDSASGGEPRRVVGGRGQQRFADVDDAYVVATDFGEDPDGRYDADGTDLSDVVVLDRRTGVLVARALPGKQAFPMLADGGLLAYLSWATIHPEPKFQNYELRTGALLGNPAADRSISTVRYAGSNPARPSVIGRTLEWIEDPDGNTTLFRAPADGSSTPAPVSGLETLRLFAPAPTSAGFTVLATSALGATEGARRLRGVAR